LTKGCNCFSKQANHLADFCTLKIWNHQSTGLKVMAKNFICAKNNFLAITFEPVDRFIPNFEGAKICMVGGLSAKAVIP